MFLLFVFHLQEMLVNASSCEKCSWKILNGDDSIATITSSKQFDDEQTVSAAFDGNNGMNLN